MSGSYSVVAASFVLSVIAVAVMLRLSHKKAWYDPTNERKIHTGDIPRLGGAGFASVFIGAACFITFFLSGPPAAFRFIPPLLALVLILISGITDDFRPMAPRYKLLIQVIAALCVVLPGYSFRRILFLQGEGLPFLSWALVPLSFFWIVGLVNAVNLIDGVDGLAGGLSTLAALGYALVFTALETTGAAVLLCACLAAAVGGFLLFNAPVPRARIFMGDGGSQFLGFTLALLPLIGGGEGPGLPLIHAAALLAIPIFDTIAAIWRRLRDGRRIDSPDRLHIHHKLINLGLNARGVDGVLWGLQILIGILVYLSVICRGALSLIFLGSAYLAALGFFTAIHFMNRAALLKAPPAHEESPGL